MQKERTNAYRTQTGKGTTSSRAANRADIFRL